MSPLQTIFSNMRGNGHRLTPVRRRLIELFAKASEPLSVPEIVANFETHAGGVNKTTIYREVDFLVAEGVLVEVHVDQLRSRYELASLAHHHHVVCDTCSTVEDVDVKALEEGIRLLEQSVKRKTHFAHIRHSLEFFGRCSACQRNG